RPYSEKITQVMAALAALPVEGRELHPLLQRRTVANISIVHITPDRGLAGGLVSNINRMTGSFVLESSVPVKLIAVGSKGIDFMRRSNQNIVAEFTDIGDHPGLLDTLPISHIIIEDFKSGAIDEVYLAYTKFINTMSQQTVMEKVLPVKPAEISAAQNVEYLYEPDPAVVLGGLLPRFVEMQVYHAILEAIASEQSARMVAMRNATENAKELIEELTLLYNKARQEMITTELLDITGGAVALE
ncbi:MAG: ATP synthase F1 subunit gamma, partial [Dehalococcoidales bacterium]|nr:ATP synthase F1 subunit gamma [Dehalococcoidales bacterium]